MKDFLNSLDLIGRTIGELENLLVQGDLDLTWLGEAHLVLPKNLVVKGTLNVSGTGIRELPDGLKARRIKAQDCKNLVRVGTLTCVDANFSGCKGLSELAGLTAEGDVNLSMTGLSELGPLYVGGDLFLMWTDADLPSETVVNGQVFRA